MSTTTYTDPDAQKRATIRRWGNRWGLALPETAWVELAEQLATVEEQPAGQNSEAA